MMDTTNCNLCQNDRISPNGLRKCSCYGFVSRFIAEPIEFLMNFKMQSLRCKKNYRLRYSLFCTDTCTISFQQFYNVVY